MRKYFLFAGFNFYPSGGWRDFQGSFGSIAAATASVAKHKQKFDWWHIVDRDTERTVHAHSPHDDLLTTDHTCTAHDAAAGFCPDCPEPELCSDCESVPATTGGRCENCHDRAGEAQDERTAQSYYGGTLGTADYAQSHRQQIAKEDR